MANIPFIALQPIKVDESIFRFKSEQDQPLMVILCQNGIKDSQGNITYQTSKMSLMRNNGNYDSERGHILVQARVTDKYRRLQILLISRESLESFFSYLSADPMNQQIDPSIFTSDFNLKDYAEYSHEVSLRDLSLYCKNMNLYGKNGRKDYIRSDSGELFEFSYEVQLLNSANDPEAGNRHMKQNIWNNDEEAEQNMDINYANKNYGRIPDLHAAPMRVRAARKTKNQQKVKYKRNHLLQLKYFKDPRACAICGEYVWGIAKEPGYECQICGLVVHNKCIPSILNVCPGSDQIYASATGHNAVLIDTPHNLRDKFNLFSVKSCKQTGAFIYPFSKYQQCKVCSASFKLAKGRPVIRNCGVDEQKIVNAVNSANADLQNRNEELKLTGTDLIYGKVDQITVNKDDIEKARIDQLATTTKELQSKLNLNNTIKNKIKDRKAESKKKLKASQFNDFQVLSCLGQGSFGKVLLGKYKSSRQNNFVAIKAIRKDSTLENYDVKAVHDERDVLLLDHPFITKLICTFHDPQFLYFVMELLTGGDLMNYVIQRGKVSTKIALTFGVEILLGLRFLHDENQIIYRDLKLDNIMIGADGHVRIADFGMVKRFTEDELNEGKLATTFCGTPDYMAPEILQYKPYGFKVDVWAWAVVMFEMMEGFSPFQGSTEDRLFHEIKWEEPRYKYSTVLKKEAKIKHLLDNCLNKNPDRRYTIARCLKHEVFTKQFGDVKKVEALECSPPDGIPPSSKDKFLKRFDEEAIGQSTDLIEVGGEQVRSILGKEDQIFKDFARDNVRLVNLYRM